MSKKDFLSHVNSQKEEVKAESFKEEVFVPSGQKSSLIWKASTFVLALALVVVVVMNMGTSTAMTDLKGMSLEDAESWAMNNGVILNKIMAYSDQVQEGIIIEQDLSSGSQLSAGGTVKVTVSDGFDPNEVIDLPAFDASWSKNAIVQWIEQNGIENFKFITMTSEDVKEDYLITYEVVGAEESAFTRGTYIEFITNEVSVSEQVEVTNFINKDLATVDLWARENHVDYVVEYLESDIYEAGTIISQSLVAGQSMSIDQPLVITISSGLVASNVVMENFVGDSVKSAITWLKGKNIPYTLTYTYSDLYAEDMVIDQSILNQQMVFDGDIVGLTVSLGIGEAAKDFSKFTKNEAEDRKMLEDPNVVVKESFSTTVPKGHLISQSVSPGSYYNADQPLLVEYSLGSNIAIEDYRGKTILDFTQWLEDMNQKGGNLSVNETYLVDGTTVTGEIISQSAVNAYLGIGSTIDITISKGSTMPDFYGMSKSEIESYDAKSIMTIDLVELYYDGKDKGVFISQSILPGTVVDENTVVTVKLSLGDKVSTPDFMGNSINELETWVTDVNAQGANLNLSVYETFSDDVPYGKIVSQSPFNIYTPIGSDVSAIVSMGTSVKVPDLQYYSPTYVKEFADDNGYLIVIDYEYREDLPEGTFLSQSFEAHTEISSEQIIKVIYSTTE